MGAPIRVYIAYAQPPFKYKQDAQNSNEKMFTESVDYYARIELFPQILTEQIGF